MTTTRVNASLRKGFTLIELLIVVAIIAILATIAVLNFQLASVRSKTARAQTDFRTLSTGLESYRVDNRAYPNAALGDLTLQRPLDKLTTPVVYLSSVPNDPFGPAPLDFNAFEFLPPGYQYRDAATTSVGMPGETYGEVWSELPHKAYFLHSAGPNRRWDVTPFVEYDPTNGVISNGDLIRFGPS